MSIPRHRIYRAYETIVTMLGDRQVEGVGFTTDNFDTSDLDDIIDAEEDKKYNKMTFKRNDEEIDVYWVSKVTSTIIKQLSQTKNAKSDDKFHMLIFSADVDFSKVVDCIEKMKNKICVEIFTINELAFPIVKHVYVKPHRKLSDQEKEEIYEYFDIKDDQEAVKKMPILLLRDPISRYYDFNTFDVIVINEDEKPYFRIVFPNIKVKTLEKSEEDK
jgi:DNA-directed RNA polymerase subunit H (RpoH/RPB5)